MSLDLACDPKQGNLRAVRFCEIYVAVLSRSLIVDQANGATPLGDFQVSVALVPPQPAESDGAVDTGAELLATAASRQISQACYKLTVFISLQRGTTGLRCNWLGR